MTAVADILSTYTGDQIRSKLLAYLQAADVPVTDWYSGAFVRDLMEQWQLALANYLGVPAPDPFLRQMTVSGAVPVLPAKLTRATSAWLTLVADQLFNVQRNFVIDGAQFANTFTKQNITLTCDASHGPYTITAGTLWATNPSTGNRYVNTNGGTLSTSGTLTLSFQAENANDSGNGFNYSDGAGTITQLDPPIPGVTISNAAPTFSAVKTDPSPSVGPGTITVSGTPPAVASAYDIVITTSGQSGSALFKYRSNGGAWVTNQTSSVAFVIPSGPTLDFVNDPGGGNPSFVAGDRYYFTSPGTPITQQGLDPETDAALLERCLGRWVDPTLTPDEKHRVWAKAASPLVNRVHVSADTKPGYYDVSIAGIVNPLAGAVVTAVQLYIDQHEAIGNVSTVAAASLVTVTPEGTAYVPTAQLATVQSAASAAWNLYVNGTDIGGIVRIAVLEQILMDAGCSDVSAIQINSSSFNLQLTSTEVGEPASIVANITWVAI